MRGKWFEINNHNYWTTDAPLKIANIARVILA
jgi:hypothetical protein